MENKLTLVTKNSTEKDSKRILRIVKLEECWFRQYHSAVTEAFSDPENKGIKLDDCPQENLMTIAFAGIKYANALCELMREYRRIETDAQPYSLETAQALFDLLDAIFMIMGHIKLKNLITIFPITKKYDGEKWNIKDYFYTMEALAEKDMDKPIGRENMSEFLWDYENDDLRKAYIEYTCAMKILYRDLTGIDMAEKLADELLTCSTTDDIQAGKFLKRRKKSHLEVVK